MACNVKGNSAVMMANYSGVCVCGCTVGNGDFIAYDHAARKIVRCVGCGLDIGGHAWKFKGFQSHSDNHVRRGRCEGLAGAELMLEAAHALNLSDKVIARRESAVAEARELLRGVPHNAADLAAARKSRAAALAASSRADSENAEDDALAAKHAAYAAFFASVA